MSIQLVIANIALETTTLSRQDFGSVLHAAKHNYWPERVKTFTSIQSAVEGGVPVDSILYNTLTAAFSQEVKVPFIKVARHQVDQTVSIEAPTTGKVYSIKMQAKDATENTYTFTAGGASTEEDVVDDLIAKLAADADMDGSVAFTKVGTGSTTTMTIGRVAADDWFISEAVSGISIADSGTATETAGTLLTAIKDVDDSFYYITAEEKDNTFVTAMAAAIEADFKFYGVSVAEAGSYASPMTGTLADLINTTQEDSVYPMYSHDAATLSPELAVICEIAPYRTGRITFSSRQVKGIVPALASDGVTRLTSTQTANLLASKVNFSAKLKISGFNSAANASVMSSGYSASGKAAADIVARDNLQVDMEANLSDLLARQRTGRIAFDRAGLNAVRGEMRSTLNSYADEDLHNWVFDDFVVTVPEPSDILTSNKAAHHLKQATFSATLKGYIDRITLTGSVGL